MPDQLHAFIEIPKGGRNKYEYDEQLQAVVLDRFLASSTVYPLDAMVCVSEPTFPGCVIPVKPIALFKMHDDKGEDDKIVCVPMNDPGWNHAEVLEDIPQNLQREIEHFFSIYKQLEGKQVDVQGWRSREEALEVIADGRRLEQEHKRGPEPSDARDG